MGCWVPIPGCFPLFCHCIAMLTCLGARKMCTSRDLDAPPDRDERPGARVGHGVRGQEESPLVCLHNALLHPFRKHITDALQRYNRQDVKAESTRTVLRHVRDEKRLKELCHETHQSGFRILSAPARRTRPHSRRSIYSARSKLQLE